MINTLKTIVLALRMLTCQNKDAECLYPDNGIGSEHRSVTEPKSRKTYKAKVVPTFTKNKKIKYH